MYVYVRGGDQRGRLKYQINGANSSRELQKWKTVMGEGGEGKKPGPHQHLVWSGVSPPAGVVLNEKFSSKGIKKDEKQEMFVLKQVPAASIEPWLKKMQASQTECVFLGDQQPMSPTYPCTVREGLPGASVSS